MKSSFVLASPPADLSYNPDMMAFGGPSVRIAVERATVLLCRHCKDSCVVLEEEWIGGRPWNDRPAGGDVTWRGFFWWPLPAAQVSEDVPAEIRSCFAEAVRARAANCPRASAVMARRTLESVCAEKGATGKDLATQLADLSSKGHLAAALAEWSREVRLVGNRGAHFDPADPVTHADAEQLVSFVQELLGFLYEIPAALARRRAAAPGS